jgi:hypothetical protein
MLDTLLTLSAIAAAVSVAAFLGVATYAFIINL